MNEKGLRLSDILTPQRTLYKAMANSKKRTFEIIADAFSLYEKDLPSNLIFDKLIARERIGPTALGHGVAIPHARVDIAQPLACFVLLQKGVDFDSDDKIPVDLLFSLIVPEEATEQHLQLLALIANIMSKFEVREQCRQSHSREELYEILVNA